MAEAVIFGAGNVGRGFLGQLFAESGYELVFVDLSEPLLAALNRGEYTVRMVDGELVEDVRVGPTRALRADDGAGIAAVVSRAPLLATAVGARALPAVAATLAAGLRARASATDAPANVVVCENLKGAAAHLRGLVAGAGDAAWGAWLDRRVGFVDAVVGRMVPLVPPEVQARDAALVVVEPYRVLPVARAGFVGPPPAVGGMEPCDHFDAYVDRKLYLHNGGHAVLAYLGHQAGYTYGWEAMADRRVARAVLAALDESKRALTLRHGLDPVALAEHAADLARRFRNRALGDTVFRLGRDVARKLGREDRLVGAALLAREMGVEPRALAWGIAAGLAFADPRDPFALDLAARLARDGLAALREICGLDPASPVGQLVADRWRALRAGRLWADLEDDLAPSPGAPRPGSR